MSGREPPRDGWRPSTGGVTWVQRGGDRLFDVALGAAGKVIRYSERLGRAHFSPDDELPARQDPPACEVCGQTFLGYWQKRGGRLGVKWLPSCRHPSTPARPAEDGQ